MAEMAARASGHGLTADQVRQYKISGQLNVVMGDETSTAASKGAVHRFQHPSTRSSTRAYSTTTRAEAGVQSSSSEDDDPSPDPKRKRKRKKHRYNRR